MLPSVPIDRMGDGTGGRHRWGAARRRHTFRTRTRGFTRFRPVRASFLHPARRRARQCRAARTSTSSLPRVHEQAVHIEFGVTTVAQSPGLHGPAQDHAPGLGGITRTHHPDLAALHRAASSACRGGMRTSHSRAGTPLSPRASAGSLGSPDPLSLPVRVTCRDPLRCAVCRKGHGFGQARRRGLRRHPVRDPLLGTSRRRASRSYTD